MTALRISAMHNGATWCPAIDAIADALEARYGLDGDTAEAWAVFAVRAHRDAMARGEAAS